MKTLLFTLLVICSSYIFGQQKSLLRTDGIYIYDNGLDVISGVANSTELSCAQYVKVARGTVTTGEPCGQGDVVPIDMTSNIFLACLTFFSDSTGIALNIGACRDEQNIREKALLSLTRQATNYKYQPYIDTRIKQMILQKDSTIAFGNLPLNIFSEQYSGRAFGNSLILEMRRNVPWCDQVYITTREYVFYSYHDIFNCDWVYKKPEQSNKP